MVIAMLALVVGQTLYTDHGNPTAAEQRVLEIINRARANPTNEGTRLGIAITEGLTASEAADVGPRPPLAMNADLLTAARAHSLDMYARAFFAHTNPDGDDPGDRMTAAGYTWIGYAENIAMATSSTAESLEDLLMIDAGVAGRGHRKALLDIEPGSSTYYREVGIGYHSGPSAKPIPPFSGSFRDFLTEDFGRSATLPFLLGVAYLDADGDLFYDEGEGLGGVAVTPSIGSFRAVTASAGGYAFPTASSGAVNVTGASTSLPADIVVAVTLTSANQKVDFRVAPQPDADGDGLPNFWETRFGPLAPGDDTDSDTFTNLQEFRGGSDPTNAASTPSGSPAPPPPPPPAGGGSSDDGDGGGCGATGLDGLAAAMLASLLFRGRRRV